MGSNSQGSKWQGSKANLESGNAGENDLGQVMFPFLLQFLLRSASHPGTS